MRLYTRYIILTGVLLRVVIAFWNGFFGPSPGADLDALGLNGFASAVAVTGSFDEFSIGYTPYTNLLGLFYSLTIDHIFVGSILSCFVWWLSAYILYKSFLMLSVDRQRINQALLIYALLPSSIMFTAVTLREPYQLLFVNLAIYAVLKIYLHKANRHWVTLVLAIVGAGSLHGGLLAFGILFFAGTLLLVSMRGKKGISWAKLGLLGAVAVVVLWYGFSFFGNFSYNLDEGLDSAVETYQQGLLGEYARTNYKPDVEFSGFSGLLLFVPVGLFQYLFEPFPWHISAASDAVALFENMLRGWLIWKAWKAVCIAPAQQRRVLLFVFISYLMMETIWSIGTINWGTSIRHHLPVWGLLLLAAYAFSDGKVRAKKITRYFQPKINSTRV